MKFIYFKKTGVFYRTVTYPDGSIDMVDDGDDGYEFEYDVDYKRLRLALAEILGREYDIAKNALENLISNCDLEDILAEQYMDELHDYFLDQAMESV